MNVKTFLLRCGWTKGVGANFYLPNTHPHIHLILDGVGLDTIEVGTNDSYRNKQDAYNVLRPQIRVVAISDGQRGANLISGGIETKNIKNALNVLLTYGGENNPNIGSMKTELLYILQAYGFGY